MASGLISKDILKDFKEEKEKVQHLEEKLIDKQKKYNEKISEVRGKLQATRAQLVKMQNTVVKPMITEMRIAAELKMRYQKQYEMNFEDLKTLNAIIRLPRMADQFYKTIKRKESAELSKKIEQDAIKHLRSHVD